VITEETPFGETTYLSFYRLIQVYIAPFHKVEPASALQYAYLVALGADSPGGVGKKQQDYALELVRDIVLASRAWGRLLGSVKADGSKTVSFGHLDPVPTHRLQADNPGGPD
jgi:nuclear pore complex protein Nup93